MDAIRTVNPPAIRTASEPRRSGNMLPGTVAALTLVSNFVVLQPAQALVLALAVGFGMVMMFFGDWLKLRRLYALAGVSVLGGAALILIGLAPALSVAIYATWIGVALMISGLLAQPHEMNATRTGE
ncbi:MAG TPA: hypothetical protein PKD09_07120 [Aggregatilinea sp.]|jgi:hypothetical protein|uniref:hypothetical protein n=1 Tax=Aggregatilinea sp. TaxID=2806333 RepID=UPI002C531EF6|nr:hypothetical protein [Aggregatilinea sp.]HML21398.1 hypothetical protein [Aggregatilinea sp.]